MFPAKYDPTSITTTSANSIATSSIFVQPVVPKGEALDDTNHATTLNEELSATLETWELIDDHAFPVLQKP